MFSCGLSVGEYSIDLPLFEGIDYAVGGPVGVRLSDITTGFSGLIQKITLGIADLAKHIGTIAGQGNTGGPHFIEQMVWLFVGLVSLCCLPAFFAD